MAPCARPHRAPDHSIRSLLLAWRFMESLRFSPFWAAQLSLSSPSARYGGKVRRAQLLDRARDPSLPRLLQLGRAQVDDRKAEEGVRQRLMGQRKLDRNAGENRATAGP